MTQRLKLEPSPISETRVDHVFSPVCECTSRQAKIEFSLRRADDLRIAVRIGAREVTVADRPFPRGPVHVSWDGHEASGAIAPDGVYYPVVHLRRSERTIDLPNPIRIDTQPPSIRATGLRSNGPKLRITYIVSEPAHALLIVDGRRAVFTYSTRRHGRLTWYGRVRGRIIRPSRHRLVLVAEDLAGNRSAPARLR